MPPDWVRQQSGLSPDADLRRLQLRWFRDELWMRRLVLAVALSLQGLSMAALIFSPSANSLTGAGVVSLIALPLAYFFGPGFPRRRLKPRRARHD